MFRVTTGPGDVWIQIFTESGQLLHEAAITNATSGVGGEQEYEYTWSAGGVASQVLVAVITTTHNGNADRKRIPFALIK